MFRVLDGISFVYGDMGSGKSLYGAFRSDLMYSVFKREIYSNSRSLKVPHKHVDIDELIDEAENPHWDKDTKKYFFLDEVKTIADGYSPPTTDTIRKLRILFTQFRKRHAIVDYCDQLETGPQYFLRRLTNYIVSCDADRHFGEENPYRIVYRWLQIKRDMMVTKIRHGAWAWDKQVIEAIGNLYNTYEIIEAPA